MTTFGWDSATAYHHEGVSMMNGRSDTGEIFTQADFQTVLNYATSKGLARYTYWSVNRDRQCSPPDNNGQTSGSCSSVSQGAWDFTKYTTQFAGATPPTTIPTSTPTTTPPTGSCNTSAWSPTQVYTQGMTASEAGHKYTAKWWTQNEDPATHHGASDVWTDNGTCTGGTATPTPTPTPTPTRTATPTPTPTPTPTQTGQYPTWVANHAYAVGDRVSYGGHNYQCRQAHTSLVGWEPPNVPALWLAI
jgi:chitodextrinase